MKEMFKFGPVEVISATILPVLIGFPLAIYTGVIVYRILEFQKAKRDAMKLARELDKILVNSRGPRDAEGAIVERMFTVRASFADVGQIPIAARFVDLIVGPLNSFLGLVSERLTANELYMIELTDQQRWTHFVASAFPAIEWRMAVNNAIDETVKFEPSLWCLLRPDFLPVDLPAKIDRYLRSFLPTCDCCKQHSCEACRHRI